MTNIIKNENGFLNLIEAIMAQAYKDAESSNEKLANEAKAYIEKMKRDFT